MKLHSVLLSFGVTLLAIWLLLHPGEKPLTASTAAPPYALAMSMDDVQAPAAGAPTEDDVATQLQLRSINGISLYDDLPAVLRKLGEPPRVDHETILETQDIYIYPNMSIVFSDGVMVYIDISSQADKVMIDDSELPVTLEALTEALGQPDYINEDGMVYKRREVLVKLHIDENTGELRSISYYTRAVV